jgi:Alginate lyase
MALPPSRSGYPTQRPTSLAVPLGPPRPSIDGQQCHELNRSEAQHYCCFNLQTWINLATLAEKCGTDLWRSDESRPTRLKSGLEWFLVFYDGGPWPFVQEAPFDRERFLPLYHTYRGQYGDLPGFEDVPDSLVCPPLMNPNYGIGPFWMLR